MLKHMINLDFIKSLPFEPFIDTEKNLGNGVYRMFNSDYEVIYIGKSKDLDVRLHNHLAKRTHTAPFIDEVVYIDVYKEPIYETLLESMLIAFYEPKYNKEIKNSNQK